MPPRDPAVVCTYAPSGTGKTTDCGYSFPNALFLAAAGALESIRSTCGYEPAEKRAESIEDATKLIIEVSKTGKFDAVVVDDFSYLAEQTVSKLEKKFTGFKMWGELRDVILGFRDEARRAKMHVIMNCWQQGPKSKPDGTMVRGGPKLPSDLPESVPALCDLVLRGAYEAARQPWPAVYDCWLDPGWTMKDRYTVLGRKSPMNLGEILRLAGHEVKRHPSMPWQEEWVSRISTAALEGQPADDVALTNQAYSMLRNDGATHEQATWTVRDGIDRATLIRARMARQGMFVSAKPNLPPLS